MSIILGVPEIKEIFKVFPKEDLKMLLDLVEADIKEVRAILATKEGKTDENSRALQDYLRMQDAFQQLIA